VTAVIELAPAGTLTGIAKRELPGVELLAVKTPDDIASALALIESRPAHGQGEHTLDFWVVSTPAKGVFTRADGLAEGAEVARGSRLGIVTTNRDEHVIVAPHAGVLAEWLRHDGDIVAAGLPVARIQNESELG
jgi:[acyl-carrier-protein] S-malonyltransferase